MPRPNSHPHDPALAPDGALWYTGQESNTLGRLDPVTGKVREFQLKTPDSGPHGLVADRAGNIWFTANFKGYMGSSIREQAKSPNTPCLTRVRTTRIRPCSTRKDLFQLRPPFRAAVA